MQLVLLDACVLYPMYLRDVLLHAAETELFGPLWSAEILTEMHRNLVANRVMPAEGADRLLRELRRSFTDSEVTGYEPLVETMNNHPKDRHVLAAAVHARADLLVTANLKDFPTGRFQRMRIVSPDVFLLELLGLVPDAVIGVLRQMVKDYQRPPRDLAGLLDALEATVPGFVGVVRGLTS